MKKLSTVCHLEGGSGAGVNIQPVGFLVITENTAKMIPVDHCSALDKLLDYVPDLLDKISEVCGRNKTYTYEFYENGNTCKCKEKESMQEDSKEE